MDAIDFFTQVITVKHPLTFLVNDHRPHNFMAFDRHPLNHSNFDQVALFLSKIRVHERKEHLLSYEIFTLALARKCESVLLEHLFYSIFTRNRL